ncbi:hypothetical protein [Bacillus coahuilensis]|uniref:hypothetical protein n=1 Tax=Bacillus coahuilensis TaxID=408580 RepID=UPI000185130E|nr:hypothetical protein [Bacillus coahuilensis]
MKVLIDLTNNFSIEVDNVPEEQEFSIYEDYSDEKVDFIQVSGETESFIIPKKNIFYINFYDKEESNNEGHSITINGYSPQNLIEEMNNVIKTLEFNPRGGR